MTGGGVGGGATGGGVGGGATGGGVGGGATGGGVGGGATGGGVGGGFAGDDCVNAIPVTLTGGMQITGTTVGATNATPTGSSPTCSQSASSFNPDVVYRATFSTPVRIRATALSGTNYAPVIYARRFAQCADMTDTAELTCANQLIGAPEIDLPASASPIALFVDGASSNQTIVSGAYRLDVSTVMPASNDSCAAPTNLGNLSPATPLSASGNTTNALQDDVPSCGWSGNYPPRSGPDLVYQFTTNSTYDLDIGLDAGFFGKLSLRPQASCASSASDLGCISSYDTVQLFRPAVPPGQYVVWVDGLENNRGAFGLSVRASLPAPPPGNDVCTSAQAIGLNATVRATTRSANNAAGPSPSCNAAARATGADVFFTVANSGPTVVSAANLDNSVGVVLAAAPTACGFNSEVACATAAYSGSRGEHVQMLVADAGAPFGLTVDSTTNYGSPFILRARGAVPPNDSCSTPETLLVSTPSQDQSTVDSLAGANLSFTSANYMNTPCVGIGNTSDVFYTFTPTMTRTYTVSVQPQSDFDVTLIRMPSCTPSICTEGIDASGQGGPESLTFAATAGVPVVIAVGSYGSTRGAFRLLLQ